MEELLNGLYLAQDRISAAEIRRAALAADLPAEAMVRIDALPEGEYAEDEAAEALGIGSGDMNDRPPLGQPDAEPEPDAEDFAAEHANTAVDKDITTGRDTDREPESPRGWAGSD